MNITKNLYELTKTKKALQEAQKANMGFLAKMSHELRTPMNVIIANTQMLVQGFFGNLSTTQTEKLSDIFEHAQDLLTLINDILDFSKLSTGPITLNKSQFNLSKFLHNIAAGFQIFFYNKQTTFHTDIEPDIFIYADPHRIKQVINNLMTNALKFTNQGTITLSLKHQSTHISIKVIDTGIGIEPQYLTKVFKEFFQVPSHKRSGTGIGLSISKSFTEMHNGTLTVTSKHMEGSEFTITLPRENHTI